MQRKFFRDTLICLVPVLLALWVSYVAYQKYREGRGGFKLGVDLVGGTILVYEVDPKQTQQLRGTSKTTEEDPASVDAQRKQEGGLSKDEMAQLAAALKRRIDPTDLKNVTIRPVGTNRIEIILPAGGQSSAQKSDFTQEEINEVRRLVSQTGTLEFRILANNDDDKEAILRAQERLEEAKTALELDRRAIKGEPPPPPDGNFDVNGLATNYSWVELGKEERASLRLNNDSAERNDPNSLWGRVAKARAEGKAYLNSSEDRQEETKTSMLIYSRDCKLTNQQLAKEKQIEYFVLTRVKDSVQVSGDVSITAQVDTDNTGIVVAFRFNGEGARQFGRLTSRNKPETLPSGVKIARNLAIILDGTIKSAPTIRAVIRDRGQISGNYTKKDADQLVYILKSGALSAVLKPDPVSEYTIGSTLGADTIRKGTESVVWAFVAVLVFMIVYYRFAGFVATVALFANLILTIGFMVLVNATFTLPGLAGLVLMLALAVDANVLIYERVREERDRGASLLVAIRNGYDRAFPTIIDTHLSSIFTAIVLYAVGNDQLKGFGISLTVGLVISLFTSLFMTRLMFDYWHSKHWLKNLRMLRFFSRPNIDFMAIRKPMFAATAILTVVGLALFLFRGRDGLNIDFLGGTAYTGQLKAGKLMEVEEYRALLEEKRQRQVLKVEQLTGEGTRWSIKYQGSPETLVTLANPPIGKTPEEQKANLETRLSYLPDWSVEQIFDAKSENTRSRLFTVRTTEKEQDLVKVMIDRLFQEKGESLLAKISFKIEEDPKTKGWKLRFIDADTEEPTVASGSYLANVIKSRFIAEFPEYKGADAFDLRPDPESKVEDGKHDIMLLIPGDDPDNPGLKDHDKVSKLLAKAQRDFQDRPQPERLENVDETLAKDMKLRAFYAIVASWTAILGYLWFRFGNWTFGLAAVLCLIHDLFFTLGAIAACHYVHDTTIGKLLLLQDFKIDLPAIAALLTLVGYSVNDTIVVFDRIREVRGKNPKLTPQMINDSINQTLSRTLLTSLITFLVVVVLYIFGGEGVHLFAFVMVIGVVVGTYSSIYIASPLLMIFREGEHQEVGAITEPEPEPESEGDDELEPEPARV